VRLQKYDSYKDSGIEWLGEIPSEWEIEKLKFNTNIFSGNSISDHKKSNYEFIIEESFAYISTKDLDINDSSINYDNGLRIPKTNNDFKVANKNSTLLCIEGGSAGRKISFTNQNICFVNKLACISSIKNNDSKYIYYLIKSSIFKSQFNLSMNGLIGGVSLSILKNFDLTFPPLQEQQKIALFLDTKTQQLDKAIKQKEQLIKLLKERKQIVINEAVTKGLDKTVTMKDSGVEWLGEIPKHWEVKKIKYLGKFINGYAFNSNEFVEEGIRVMKISNIQTMKTDWTDSSYISEKYYDKLKQFRVNENDLVFALTRPIISTGIKATIIKDTEKILLNQRNTMLKPNSIVYIKWLYFIILNNDFIQIFDNLIDKTGQQPNISTKDIENIEIPLPHKDEQKQIVEYIENQTSKIDNAIDLQQKQIDKLKEYKTSLIDSIVTGKVRVCDE